jgi:hypothetical protein
LALLAVSLYTGVAVASAGCANTATLQTGAPVATTSPGDPALDPVFLATAREPALEWLGRAESSLALVARTLVADDGEARVASVCHEQWIEQANDFDPLRSLLQAEPRSQLATEVVVAMDQVSAALLACSVNDHSGAASLLGDADRCLDELKARLEPHAG